MISNFGLYLSNVPDEIGRDNDIVHKGPEPEYIEPMKLVSGLNYSYYMGGIQTAALIISTSSVKLEKTGKVNTINIQPAEALIGYSFSYEGYIKAPQGGTYTFKLESVDGSVLFIGEKLFIDNDEPHEIKAIEKKIGLKSGYYPIKVLYTSFRHNGMLKVSWSGPGFDMKEIEPDYLFKA